MSAAVNIAVIHLAVLLAVLVVYAAWPRPILVGSHWIYKQDVGNPFELHHSKVVVINVQGKWVQYRYTHGSEKFSYPRSIFKSIFRIVP